MQRLRALVENHLWLLVLVIAVVMLLVHGLGVRRFVIDNTSLILLALILASPLLAAVRKIKIGEFEAEIEPAEVKSVARQVENSLPEPSLPIITKSQKAPAIKVIAESDPVAALAKLRIELESKLRQLYRSINPDATPGGRHAPLASVIRDLVAGSLIGPELSTAVRRVIAICNRAIHGEDIRDVDARQIVDVGIDMIDALERIARDRTALHPVERLPITPLQLETFQNARYRLTTVIPYVEKPEQLVYVLTQEELNDFFDGYAEFAEFIVALERVGDDHASR
jgi:hypothetical protein